MNLIQFLLPFRKKSVEVIKILKRINESNIDIERNSDYSGLINRIHYKTNIKRELIKNVLDKLIEIDWEIFLKNNKVCINRIYKKILIFEINKKLEKIWERLEPKG